MLSLAAKVTRGKGNDVPQRNTETRPPSVEEHRVMELADTANFMAQALIAKVNALPKRRRKPARSGKPAAMKSVKK